MTARKKAALTAALVAILVLPMTATAAENFFLRALGGPDNDRAEAVMAVRDRIYFGGVKDAAFPVSKGLLLATDGDGNVLLEKVYEDLTPNPVEITALAHDGPVLFAAGHLGFLSTFTSAGAFVMAVSVEGDILWQRVLETAKEEFIADLIVSEDGGLLAVGTLFTTGTTIGDGWVVKLDAGGNIEWQREIGTMGNDGLAAAVELPAGGYVLAGGVGTGKDPTFTQWGFLVVLDEGGNLIWQKAYEVAAGDSFRDVLLTRDGIMALGIACGFCFAVGDGWIVNTDADGGPFSSEFIGDFDFEAGDTIIGAGHAAQGTGFFVFGSSDSIVAVPAVSQQMWAARFDGRGNLRWIRQIGAGGFEMAGAMTVLRQNNIAFGGYTIPSGGADHEVLIGKLDKNGRALDECDQVAGLDTALRDAMTLTSSFDPGATVGDSGTVAVEGWLVVDDDSPTTGNELLCFD